MASSPCTSECSCRRCSKCAPGCACGKHRPRFGENAPNWQGASVGYEAVHYRLREERGSPTEFQCSCGQPAQEWAYLGGSDAQQSDKIGRPFTTDLSYYVPQCRRCHRKSDRNSPKRYAA